MATDLELPPFAQDIGTKFTAAPNPDFTLGQKVADTELGKKWVEGEQAGWKVVDTATEDPG